MSKEHHEYQCRALSIPIEIVHEVQQGSVSVKEAYLLAIIDGLVRCRGDGCYASDAWLAVRVQVKVRQLQNILRSLIRKKLITVTETPTKRIIETKWARKVERSIDEDEAVKTYRGSVTGYEDGGNKLPMIPIGMGALSKDVEECPTRASGDDPVVPVDPSKDKPRRQKQRTTSCNPEDSKCRQVLPVADGFFPEEPKTKGRELAEQLHAVMEARGAYLPKDKNRNPDFVKWGEEFTTLLTVRSYETITAAIVQHGLHYGEKYWPRCKYGRPFCEKFDDIEAAIGRLTDNAAKSSGNVSTQTPAAPISDTARKIADTAERLSDWPKGSAAQLLGIMQPSIDNFEDLRRRLKHIRDTRTSDADISLRRFAMCLLEEFDRPTRFFEGWFQSEAKRLSRWEDWSGKLTPFSIKHCEFPKWIKDYHGLSGTRCPVDRMLAALDAAKSSGNVSTQK
jgi:hypothetical protein